MAAALVVALATAVRLAWVLLVPSKPVGDFAMYLESAAHLVEQGALDPEFVYMPGYVLLLALVQALGGGVLTAKLLGVALGGAGAGAVYGIAHHLWNRRAALVAGLLYAVWPAGIAISSVTGTDLPSGVLIALAGWCLVRWGPRRPMLAAALFGLAMGMAAWIRAVALPLAAFGAFYFRARGGSWRSVVKHTAVACAVAFAVLAPWALRNGLRYGEVFFTDSHGGLTALVGANPNSEGSYSRSLNRMFSETTGYTLLAEPHRRADRAAYAMAREWSAFEPVYALGLVVAKAERLLDRQRALLYWPLYRAGVLRPSQSAWFIERRRQLELIADVFWVLLVGAGLFGLGVAGARRHWSALSFVPIQLALVAIYAFFFAEVRYQLPIAILLFPAAGAGWVWLGELVVRTASERRVPPETRRPTLVGVAAVALVFGAWSALTRMGASWRREHRWAAHVCELGQVARICKWRPAGDELPGADSGLRGVWNGIGVSVGAAAETRLDLGAGRYRVRARLDLAPLPDLGGPASDPTSASMAASASASLSLSVAHGQTVEVTVPLAHLDEQSREGRQVAVDTEVEVVPGGGPLVLRLEAPPHEAAPDAGASRVWLDELHVDRL